MARKTTLLTTKQAAEALATTPDTMRRWARKQVIECVRLPSGGIRFRQETIEKLAEPAATSASI